MAQPNADAEWGAVIAVFVAVVFFKRERGGDESVIVIKDGVGVKLAAVDVKIYKVKVVLSLGND